MTGDGYIVERHYGGGTQHRLDFYEPEPWTASSRLLGRQDEAMRIVAKLEAEPDAKTWEEAAERMVRLEQAIRLFTT